MKNEKLLKIVFTGIFAALSYVVFTFLQIKIPLPGGDATSIHLGNAVCVLGALLLGGVYGGLGGAIGMTIGDLFDPVYVVYAPKTFILKFCIGLIVGLVAHGIFKLADISDKKKIAGITVLASACGMAFNIVAEPLVGYFYKTYLLGIPQDLMKIITQLSILTTSVNALLAVVFASIFYLALRPAIKKAGLLVTEKKVPLTPQK